MKDSLFLKICVGIKFILFIASISFFVAAGTIAIHELGHSLTARYYGCPYSPIIFVPGELPNTEISCLEQGNLSTITFAGLLSTTILSLVLFFTTRKILKYISILIFAIGIIAAAIDLASMEINKVIIFMFNTAAYVLIALSTIKISYLYYKENKS
jgi:hypothetical protein